jgi:hypothetical protein
MISVRDTGLVYRNPTPNIWSRHAYFPSVMATGDEGLIVTFDRGSALEGFDVRPYITRSADGGRSWTDPKSVPVPEDELASYTCRTTRLANGNLIALVTRFDRHRRDHGLANPETDGFVETEFSWMRSADDGRTWSEQTPIAPAMDWHRFESCSPIVELGEGHWLVPTSLWRDWEGGCPSGLRAVALRSDDGGETWPQVVEVMDGVAEQRAYWEQKISVLTDGRVLAQCWTFDLEAGASLKNRYALSEDGGVTFTAPMETPLNGETCTTLALAENHLLCVYRRTDQKGLWAHVARIEGDAWMPLADAPLWGAERASYTEQSDGVFDQLSTLQFGYPQVVNLHDGDCFTVFWCVEDGVSNIRWVRFAVEG